MGQDSTEIHEIHNADPREWAKGRMIGWFANAIMAGYYVATDECAEEIDLLKAKNAVLREKGFRCALFDLM